MVTKILDMPREPKDKTVTIRVTQKVSRMIGVICQAEGLDSSDVASAVLEKALAKRYSDAVASIKREHDEFRRDHQH